MRYLFFLFVIELLLLWAAFFSRPNRRRLSNGLYAAAAVLGALLLAGYLRLV
ncbi:hypothetical protein [Ectothiorhodospira mobilis]|uniref:hypothetical protein n=1 Tax=Ectothiorhodospira mobilis TaxID=195064 RepID=UPI001907EFD3|nr:hypothetical protein [Ectothiorhodospira mobilis]